MKVKIIAVGKIKKGYISEGVCDFGRRLSKYVKIEIVEVKDEKHGENISKADEALVKRKEGERLLCSVGEKSYVVCLDVNGETISTESLVELIKSKKDDSVKEIVFIIGGPYGICEKVLERADYKLSLSKMTFPHELARLMLVEQLYRAEKILSGEPYHR